MLACDLARPGAALRLVVALALPTTASGQLPTDARASLSTAATATTGARRLELATHAEWSWLSLRANGVAAAGDARAPGDRAGSWRGGGDLSAALFAPRLGIVRAFGEAGLSRSSGIPLAAVARTSLGLRLSPARGGWGMWASAEAQAPAFGRGARDEPTDSADDRSARDLARDLASPRLRATELGAWREAGPLLLRLSARTGTAERRLSWMASAWQHYSRPLVGAGGGPDSSGYVRDSLLVSRPRSELLRQRWSSVEGRAEWMRSRLTLDASLGARPGLAGARAGAWGSVGAAASLGRRLTLRVAAGSEPDLPGAIAASRRFATIGVALTTARFRETRPHPAVRAAVTAFDLRRAGDGRWTLVVRAPHARLVEVAGDFTRWKAVPLVRGASGDWEATFAIEPGTHQLNLRVDGEGWLAPPGLATVQDDFAGRVGLLLVP